jgi:DNA ligase-1
MKTKFKPMLAASCDDLDQLRYPLLATPTIDGIRCLIIDGVAMSRSLKPIPNAYIQSVIGQNVFNGLDGVLTVGNRFQDVPSGIMSEHGEPDFTFWVFDVWDRPAMPYGQRILDYHSARFPKFPQRVQMLIAHTIARPSGAPLDDSGYSLELYLCLFRDKGYKSVSVRDPNGPYKHGRTTLKEGYLTKILTIAGHSHRLAPSPRSAVLPCPTPHPRNPAILSAVPH